MSGRSRARRVGMAAAVSALGVAAVGAGAAVLGRPHPAAPVAQVSTNTAAVTRGPVAERTRFTGTLGFDGAYQVAHQGEPGIVTAMAEAGTTLARGGIVYAVANHPVRLLYGAVPAYRDLAAGVTNGPDVRELEENLVALGMDPGRQIVVDEKFTAATAAAIRRWQTSWGLPAAQRTGRLPQGSVVFAPGPLRIAQVQAPMGAAAAPGQPVLSATSTNRVVTSEIPVARQSQVHVGDQVQVTVTGLGGPATGTVVRIGRTATAQQSGQQQQGGGNGPLTVTITIQVSLPAVTAELDQAPVAVLITAASKRDVLQVPVVALLPRTGGGYQVRLPDNTLVEVKPGLFDEVTGRIEVTGDLTAGQLVQVPVS
ncbi:peptidoglycan-binding protein [Dactylosporangium sp. CA-139066]|uniref:peptidoglycan-binding protein n=1 Tax=Dactylosporangium sp. CA-139066 TaxID=3239930 RepID=UPI003D933BCC